MKKILAMMLTAAMMLSMGTAVLAQSANYGETDNFTDEETVTITKVYKETNEGSVSPAETFEFTEFTPVSITGNDDATWPDTLPTITKIEATEGDATVEGKTYLVTITLPEYTEVGVYTYTFSEVDNKTAGVTYYGKTMTLVVTVVQEGEKVRVAAVHCESPADAYYGAEDEVTTKTDRFENIYSAGDISITKALDGNMAEKDQYFTVVVDISAPEGKTVTSNMTYSITTAEGETANSNNPEDVVVGKNTFYIKGGEKIEIKNVPYEVTYTVYELEAGANGYTTTYVVDDGESVTAKTTLTEDNSVDTENTTVISDSIDDATDTITITNTKTSEVDTGISVDSIPYIAMLGVVAVGGAGFMVSKKRRSED